MKIATSTALVILALGLLSCTAQGQSTAMNAGLLAAETRAADTVIQSGDVERAVFSIQLPEEDRATVVAAFDDYALSRSILSEVASTPYDLMQSLTTIQAERARLRDAYARIRSVITANWDDYGPAEAARLSRWEEQARRLDRRYNAFIEAVNQQLSQDARHQVALELLRVVTQLAMMVA